MSSKSNCDRILGAGQKPAGAVAKWQGKGLQNLCQATDSKDNTSTTQSDELPFSSSEIGEDTAERGGAAGQNSWQSPKPYYEQSAGVPAKVIVMPKFCEGPHDYYEGYYGTHCRNCDFFAAFGCAPWDIPDEQERDEEGLDDGEL